MLPNANRSIRYKYIHIWSSHDEMRAKCTDPETLELAVRAINYSVENGTLKKVEIQRHCDISDILHGIQISGLDDDDEYRRLAWWLFRALCDKGWEPMETSERAYKLKFKEHGDSQEGSHKWG